MASKQDTNSASSVQVDSLESLHSQLDALWAQYLNFLDEYANAQAVIKKHMSSGFFTLAQANFKSTRGRYGQDYYDERAVASTGVVVDAKHDSVSLRIVRRVAEVHEPSTEAAKEAENEKAAPKEPDTSATPESKSAQLPTPEATPEPSNRPEATNSRNTGSTNPAPDQKPKLPDPNSSAQTNFNPKDKPNPHDPIRWFGILIPPTLRQAQTSFSTAVLDPAGISQAVNSSRGMREAEAEIRRLRKAIRKVEKMGGGGEVGGAGSLAEG